MNVAIKIECENAQELLNHLKSISDTVEKRTQGDKDCKFDVGACFADRTKYGDYNVIITPQN